MIIMIEKIHHLAETFHVIPKIHDKSTIYILNKTLQIEVCGKKLTVKHIIWTEIEQIFLIQQESQESLKTTDKEYSLSKLDFQKLVNDNIYIPIVKIKNNSTKIITKIKECSEFWTLIEFDNSFYLNNLFIADFYNLNFGNTMEDNWPTIILKDFNMDKIMLQKKDKKLYFIILRLENGIITKFFTDQPKLKIKEE